MLQTMVRERCWSSVEVTQLSQKSWSAPAHCAPRHSYSRTDRCMWAWCTPRMWHLAASMSISCHLCCSLNEKRGGPRTGVSIAQNDPVSTSPSQTFLQEWMLCHVHGSGWSKTRANSGVETFSWKGQANFSPTFWMGVLWRSHLPVGFHTEFHNHIGEVWLGVQYWIQRKLIAGIKTIPVHSKQVCKASSEESVHVCRFHGCCFWMVYAYMLLNGTGVQFAGMWYFGWLSEALRLLFPIFGAPHESSHRFWYHESLGWDLFIGLDISGGFPILLNPVYLFGAFLKWGYP